VMLLLRKEGKRLLEMTYAEIWLKLRRIYTVEVASVHGSLTSAGMDETKN
jgi:hypothetical protein